MRQRKTQRQTHKSLDDKLWGLDHFMLWCLVHNMNDERRIKENVRRPYMENEIRFIDELS